MRLGFARIASFATMGAILIVACNVETGGTGVGTTDAGVLVTCSDGVQNGDETGVDCGGSCLVCVRSATCSDGLQNGGETGVDCGGPCTKSCEDIPAHCKDSVKNDTETDVDCGGSCPGCPTAKSCRVGDDCANRVCIADHCAEATCIDAIKNGAESDVDCGGTTCGGCADTKACATGADCMSGLCLAALPSSPKLCAPTPRSCTTGVKDGRETDVDCGGSDCPKCAIDKACLTNNDCGLGGCHGSVCRLNGTFPLLAYGSGTIRRYDVTGAYTTDFNTMAGTPGFQSYPAMDRAGIVYVPDSNGNVVNKVAPGTAGPTMWVSAASGAPNSNLIEGPQGIVFDAGGNALVTMYNNHKVLRIAAGTDAISELVGTTGNLTNPSGIALDASGNMYVSSATGTGRIHAFTPDGRILTSWGVNGVVSTVTVGISSGNPLATPLGVAVNRAGAVYFTENGSRKGLSRIAAGANTAVSLFTTSNSVMGVALDDAGSVYVINNGGPSGKWRVSKYDEAGVSLNPTFATQTSAGLGQAFLLTP